MVDGPVGGALSILSAIAVAAVVIGLVLYGRELAALSVRLARRLHLAPPPPPTPVGMPLEQIARDLRRLRVEARRHTPGMPVAKHRGIVAAYDDALLDACRALDIPTTLDALREGLEHESERLRVEAELEAAGIVLESSPP